MTERQKVRPEEPQPVIRIAIAQEYPSLGDTLRKLSLQPDLQVVAQTRDGRDVLQILLRQDPDILLLDWKIPGLEGISVLKQLQGQAMRTRTIVLTAFEDESINVQAIRYGSSGVLPRQVSADLLVKCIRKVHGGEFWLDARTTSAVMKEFASPRRPVPAEREQLPLSRREIEIVGLVAQGLRNREIAESLGLGEQTIKNHLNEIFHKLGMSDRLELALYAVHQKMARDHWKH